MSPERKLKLCVACFKKLFIFQEVKLKWRRKKSKSCVHHPPKNLLNRLTLIFPRCEGEGKIHGPPYQTRLNLFTSSRCQNEIKEKDKLKVVINCNVSKCLSPHSEVLYIYEISGGWRGEIELKPQLCTETLISLSAYLTRRLDMQRGHLSYITF